MTLRRLLLILMLVALAGCAALGMLALVFSTADSLWKLAGTALATAFACGVMLPLSLMVDRPRLRLGGLCAMLTAMICWGMCLVMLWGDVLWVGEFFQWRAFLIFWETLLVGVPMSGALLVAQFRWGRVAAWTFTGAGAAAYLLFVLGTLLPDSTSSFLPFSDLAGKIWATAWAVELLGLGAAALLVDVGCGDRRWFRWVGLVCGLMGFAIGLVAIWFEPSGQEWVGRVGVIAIIAAVTMGHINLLLMARVRSSQRWLLVGTIAFAMCAGVSAALAVVLAAPHMDLEDLVLVRLAAAGLIASSCGSLALIVVTLLNRKLDEPSREGGGVVFTRMQIACPNCSTRQQVPLGEAVCRSCGLQIFIKVVEPRCAGCGYLLYQLKSDRCPECGTPVGTAPAPAGEGSPRVAGVPGTVQAPL